MGVPGADSVAIHIPVSSDRSVTPEAPAAPAAPTAPTPGDERNDRGDDCFWILCQHSESNALQIFAGTAHDFTGVMQTDGGKWPTSHAQLFDAIFAVAGRKFYPVCAGGVRGGEFSNFSAFNNPDFAYGAFEYIRAAAGEGRATRQHKYVLAFTVAVCIAGIIIVAVVSGLQVYAVYISVIVSIIVLGFVYTLFGKINKLKEVQRTKDTEQKAVKLRQKAKDLGPVPCPDSIMEITAPEPEATEKHDPRPCAVGINDMQSFLAENWHLRRTLDYSKGVLPKTLMEQQVVEWRREWTSAVAAQAGLGGFDAPDPALMTPVSAMSPQGRKLMRQARELPRS